MPTTAQLKTQFDTAVRQQTAPDSITPDVVADQLDALADHIQGARQTLIDSATVTMNVANGKTAFLQLGSSASRNFAFSNLSDNDAGWIRIRQDGIGGRTITWPAGHIPATGGLALSAGANEVTIIGYIFTDGQLYLFKENFGVAAGGGSLDPDAQLAITFIEARGYTMSPTEKTALSTAFGSLKAGTLYAKRKALYILLGTTYDQAKVNVFNPVDTDAGYRLRQRVGTVATFANGITITSGGNDHGFDTADLTDTVAGQNNNTSFVVVSTNTAENRVAYGTLDAAGDGHGILPRLTMDEAWLANNSAYATGTVSTSSIGRWYNVRRGSTDMEFYKNGTSIGTFTLTSGTPGGVPFVIGNGGNTSLGAYTGKVTMAGNFDGLTDAEVTELDGIISALLMGLGK